VSPGGVSSEGGVVMKRLSMGVESAKVLRQIVCDCCQVLALRYDSIIRWGWGYKALRVGMMEAVISVVEGRKVWVFHLLVWTKLGKGDFKLTWIEGSQHLGTDLLSSLTV